MATGPELVALARGIARLPHLTLEGVAFYPGHIKSTGEESRRAIDKLAATIEQIVKDFRAADLPLNVLSGGSTPLLFESHEFKGLTEIRPGTYVFNDVNCVRSGVATWDDCAVTILATVVSTARKGYAILDGGSKTFTSDRPAGGGEVTYGYLPEAPEAVFYSLNEEHGYLDARKCGRALEVGDRLRVVPNHVCVTMNMHEKVYGIRGEQVEVTWAVEGRGKLQ